MCVVSGFLLQWRSEGRAWPGTSPAKVCPAHVRASTSVVSAVVKRTAGAWPIPMIWLRHCSLSQGLCSCCLFTSWKCVPLVHLMQNFHRKKKKKKRQRNLSAWIPDLLTSKNRMTCTLIKPLGCLQQSVYCETRTARSSDGHASYPGLPV